MSIHEKQKSCKLFRRITAGILSAVMFTGSVMANYAQLTENSTMFAAGEEPAVISENSRPLAEIAPELDYEIELKSNGQWKVTFTPKEGEYTAEIPANVMSASEFDDYRDNIDEVMFPNGITKIAAHAFEGMKSLHTVSGGYAVNEIGEAAFKDCTYLTWCQMVSPQPGSGALNSAPAIIGKEAFSNTGLTEVKMSSSLKEVGEKAFYGCKDLTSISFSGNNSNEVIFKAEAFAECTALKDIDLRKCTGSITFENGGSDQRSAFHNCTALEEVTIPPSASGNLNSLFRGATSLKTITFESNDKIKEVTHIVSGSPVEVLDLTNLTGLSSIGNWWFFEDKSITEIIIPSNVQWIAQQSMAEMSSLGTVKFLENENITNIGEKAFQYDTSLSSINLEALKKLNTISESAFDGCSALTSITIPDKVTEIQANAFGRCVGLVDLKYNAANLTNVGNGIFDGAGVFDLTIGENVKEISAKFLSQAQEHISDIKFDGTPTFTITGEGYALNAPFEAGGKYTVDSNGNLYKIEGDGAKLVYANKTAETINIPATVGNNVAVTGVASNAFRNANVKTLTFDNIGQITTLEEYAFANATLLEKINNVSEIDDVKNLFTGITEKDSIQDNVFYKTAIDGGIQDETKEEAFPPENVGTVEGVAPQSHDTAIKIYRDKTMTLNYAVGNPDDEIQDDTGGRKGKFWTGKVANVNFGYEGARSVRIYIKADKDAVINFNSSDNPPKETNIKGIYYYDVFHDPSKTGTDSLNLSYPNFTSPGSKMQVWAVEFDTEEKFKEYFSEDKERAVIYPGQTVEDENIKVSDKYFELEWTTQPDNFDLKKEWASNDSVNFIKASDGSTTVSNLKWQIIFEDVDPRKDEINLGSDIVRYVDYTDEITLPNTLKWREGIDGSLENTRFIKKGDSGTLYVNIDDKDYELFTLTNFANLVSMSVEKSSDNYLLHWRVINPSTEAEIPAVDNGYITFGSEVIVADSITAGATIGNITNKVHTDEYFTFSDVQKDDNEASTGSFKAPAGKINIKKERLNDITRMGEDVQYKITVENPSAFDYNGMTTITDDLNADKLKAHYIKPENMQALFDDGDKGNRLTITISNAVLANKLDSTDANTVAKTGTKISEQDTAADNQKYDGLAEPDASVAYRNVTIKLHKNSAGNIEINYSNMDTENSAKTSGKVTTEAGKTIADALSEIGYIVTASDSYQLEWNYKNYKLEGGEKLEFTLNTTIKDSLMYLPEKDHEYYYNWTEGITLNLFNSVTMNGNNELTADTAGSKAQAQQDLEIRKTAFVGDKEIKSDDKDYEKNFNPSDGDIIDYYVKAIHYGTDNYEVLPVVDHMTGMQAVIVDFEKNKDATWKNLATETTIDGKKYYVLNQAGTYEGVYTSEYFYADSIKVTDVDGGLDTLIKYYIEDTPGRDFTLRVPYKAILSQEFAGDEKTKLDYSFDNEAWLNDRPGHRIHDKIGKKGLAVAFDKNILVGDRNSENPDAETLAKSSSLESDKNEVTYRLELKNTGSVRYKAGTDVENLDNIESIADTLEITGKDIFDKLPLTGTAFDWSKANISNITYSKGTPGYGKTTDGDKFNHEAYGEFKFNDTVLADNTTSNGDEWQVVETYNSNATLGDPPDQQYIQWNENFTITLPPQATVYMYVTLTFAEGEQWSQFLSEKSSEVLVNTFYFCEMPASVTHNLSGTPVVLLQKGVYETGSYVMQNDVWLSGQYIKGQDRFHYSNTPENGNLKNTVTYYVVLRNSGDTNLYLAPIYDILPPGFEYMGLRTFDGNGSDWYDVGNTDTDNTFSSVPTDNGDKKRILAKPGEDDFDAGDSKCISTLVKYTYSKDNPQTTTNGCQILKFEFENYDGTDDAWRKNGLKKDATNGKYYLAPGEYLQFGYTVYTGNNPNTEAVNTVAMQYYDPFKTGIDPVVDKDTPVKVKNVRNTAPNNDGDRELWTNKEAEQFGFTETLADGNSDHKWLVSDVTVTREKISPGIKKTVGNPMIQAGGEAKWKVTSFNNSTSEISNYTITDTLDLPLYFSGKFTYSLYDSGKNWYIRAGDNKDTAEGEENNYLFEMKRDGDSIKVTSNKGDEKTFNLGDEAVTLPVRTVCYITWNGNLTYDTEISVKLTHDEENHEVLTIGFTNARWGIVPNGYSELNFSTLSPKDKDSDGNDLTPAGQYVNTARFSPEDKNYDDNITQGKLVEDENGNNLGVEHSAVVSIYTGSPSGSIKMIEEKGKTDNFTTSERDDNYIKLPDKKTPFTYTLEVRNVATDEMKNLVIIDNLPEQDDATTLRKESMRESEFKVNLAENPNIQVWLYNSEQAKKLNELSENRNKISPADYKDIEKTELTLNAADGYTVQYSSIRSNAIDGFTEPDWQGDDNNGKWQNTPSTETRSIRIKFNRQIQAGEVIQIRFDAQIDGSDKNAQPGRIAWNTFGYSYKVDKLTAKASPNKVGICIPGSPTLTKKVVDFSGKPSTVPEKTTFGFIIYKNNNPLKFDDYSEKTVAKTLNDAKIDFMYKELTVDANESESKAIPLEKFIKYDYKGDENFSKFDEPTDKTGDFWDENSNYYVVELATNDKFNYQSTNGNTTNNYRFKVDPIRNTPLEFVNENLQAPVELPETGGKGTGMFVFGGLMMICLSAFFFVRNKRKHIQR